MSESGEGAHTRKREEVKRVRQGMKDEWKKQGCTMSGEGEGKHMLSIARMQL